jgi:hypothetical protein
MTRLEQWILAIVVGALLTGGVALGRNVVINELAWAGTAASPSDEWIELFNPTEATVDLTGWTLTFGEVAIHLGGVAGATREVRTTTIAPGGYLLLERTDDATVADIPADLVYAGGLSNTGMVLRLFDATGALVDSVDGEAGWPAGSAAGQEPGYGSMERIDPLSPGAPENWRTNDGRVISGQDAAGGALRGTPRAKNSATLSWETVPVVRVLSPSQEGERLSGVAVVSWTASDPNGPSDRLRLDLYLSRDAGRTWEPLVEGMANSGSYAWSTAGLPEGDEYQLKVTATDGEGLTGEGLSQLFTLASGR